MGKTYWSPLVAREAAARRIAEINREFAHHFGPKTGWRRAIDAVLVRFGIRASKPRFYIDPSLPEDQELLAAAFGRAPVTADPDARAQTETADAVR